MSEKISKIVKREDGYHVMSERGKHLGGPYGSNDEAVKRLQQVEYFKHQGSIEHLSDDMDARVEQGLPPLTDKIEHKVGDRVTIHAPGLPDHGATGVVKAADTTAPQVSPSTGKPLPFYKVDWEDADVSASMQKWRHQNNLSDSPFIDDTGRWIVGNSLVPIANVPDFVPEGMEGDRYSTTMQEILCDRCKMHKSKPGTNYCEFCKWPPNEESKKTSAEDYQGWPNYDTWYAFMKFQNFPGLAENVRKMVLTQNEAMFKKLVEVVGINNKYDHPDQGELHPDADALWHYYTYQKRLDDEYMDDTPTFTTVPTEFHQNEPDTQEQMESLVRHANDYDNWLQTNPNTTHACPYCNGSGIDENDEDYDEDNPKDCPECGGAGLVSKGEHDRMSDEIHAIDKESKWVVAVGEKQLPGGVGAVDQPMPVEEGQDFAVNVRDNAENSVEQEAALKHWVDAAVDMLNRGAGEEEVLAKLAHDGCPDPQAVMERAMAQPREDMANDEAGQEAFPDVQTQPVEDNDANAMPMGVQARVKVAGELGTEVGRYTDMYDREIVKIALDNGHVVDVSPDQVEHVKVTTHSLLERIKDAMNELPEANNDWERLANTKHTLQSIRQVVAENINDRSMTEEIGELIDLENELKQDVKDLNHSLTTSHYDHNQEYLDNLPKFSMEAVEQASMGGSDSSIGLGEQLEDLQYELENKDLEKLVVESSIILAEELPVEILEDEEATMLRAASFIDSELAGMDKEEAENIKSVFLSNFQSHVSKRVANMPMTDQWNQMGIEKLQQALEQAKSAYQAAMDRQAPQNEVDAIMRQYMELQDKLNQTRQASSDSDGPVETLFL